MKAVQIDTGEANYLAELGYQCLLQNRMKDAEKYYKETIKLDNTSVVGHTGKVFSFFGHN